jgi:cytoskeleton protein RodZ
MQTQFPSTTTYASLGQRLRAHRIAHKLGMAHVASQLRMSVDLVEAMEHDEHARLGAPMLARACLCNYARLVDVPLEAVDSQFAHAFRDRMPADVVFVKTGTDRLWKHAAQPALQLVLGAALALMFGWMALHSHADASASTAASAPDHSGAAASQPTSIAASASIGNAATDAQARVGAIASLVSTGDGRPDLADSATRTTREAGRSNFALFSGGPKKSPNH